MSAMKELSQLLDELIECGNKIAGTAQALKDFYSEPPADEKKKTTKKKAPKPEPEEQPPVKEETSKEEPKTYSKEEVRAILAAKAAAEEGKHKSEVRELIRKYSHGGRLTDVDPADYPALVTEAENL